MHLWSKIPWRKEIGIPEDLTDDTTFDQIEKLFDLVIEEGKTAKDAALITDINVGTAQHYLKRYNDDEERRLPVCHKKPRIGAKGKLTEAHTQFLIDYVDKHPTSILRTSDRNCARHSQECVYQCQRYIDTWSKSAE